MAELLLTRDEFREAVYKRDGYRCVICKLGMRNTPATEAHHILERKLFGDSQGYFVSNGASVCNDCHLACERSIVSCDEVRGACGITVRILPSEWDGKQDYDKWGNPICGDFLLKGPLFKDPGCQKALKDGGKLQLFRDYVKYPRTKHCPWSGTISDDDKRHIAMGHFKGTQIVVTEKQDGEQSNLYRDYLHARSLDYHPHPSRNRLKALHAQISLDIPEGWRICGENLYAVHSIRYKDLSHFFQVFSIWDEHNFCLSWDDTVEWTNLLGLVTVPVMYRGVYDELKIRSLYTEPREENREGYVIRTSNAFNFKDFDQNVAKYVRTGHVTTDTHWRHKAIERNGFNV